jgi:hypothetical protein
MRLSRYGWWPQLISLFGPVRKTSSKRSLTDGLIVFAAFTRLGLYDAGLASNDEKELLDTPDWPR